MKYEINLLIAAIFLASGVSFAQLNVNVGLTPTQYVNQLLGTGVTVSNVVYKGSNGANGGGVGLPNNAGFTYPTHFYQIGSFTNGSATNLGLDSGLILSTGDVLEAVAPTPPVNGEYPTGYAPYTNGNGNNSTYWNDADLTAILPGYPNEDCSSLEFDFVPTGDSISFKYVFASSEYPSWVNSSYNDVFGFFLSGPGINGTYPAPTGFPNGAINVAIIPGTANTPVAINNLNDGNGNCATGGSSGSCNHCAYYVNNCGGTTISYHGFTTVLTVKHAVQCGQTYHIKLIIGDANDANWDSGVFLKRGSFMSSGNSGTISVTAPSNIINKDTITICDGESVTLDATVSGASGGSYSWTPGSSASSTITVSPSSTTTYVASYSYTSTSGSCSGGSTNITLKDTVTVKVNQKVIPTFAITTTLCEGATAPTLSTTSSNGITGTWTPSTVSNTASGSYVFTPNSGQCAKDTTINITVNPAITNTVNPSICQGNSYTLPGGTVVTSGGTYIDTLTSSGGCDSIITTNLTVTPNITNTVNPSICQGNSYTLPGGTVVTSSGTYIDTLTSSGGCDSIITTHLTVTASITNTVNPTICQGGTYTLPGGTQVSASGTYVDTLTSAGGCDSIITTNLTVTSVLRDTVDASICQGGTYTLPGSGNQVSTGGFYNDTLTSTGGCDSVLTTNLTVIQPVTATVSPTICQGSTYTLPGGTQVSTSGTYVDTLTSAEGCDSIITTNLTVSTTIATNQSVSVCQGQAYTLPGGEQVSAGGTYTDTLTSSGGCDSVITTNVTIRPNPTVSGSSDTNGVYSNYPIQFTGTSPDSISGWLWNFGDGSGSSLQDPSHGFPSPGDYPIILEATNQYGCSDTSIIEIKIVEGTLFIPNVISPNGDGINDVFIVKGGGYDEFDFHVYNRWGTLLHSSDGPSVHWNARTNSGKLVSAGTYYFTLTARRAGKEFSTTGYITVLR